ncbi:hypothetical protein NU10_01235 [Flavobacterium dauae]|uniref:hypothetical protein n=1 Tax=Flavobacterium dauae TaxID=1563479 RepID=UPI00101B28FC|nr:hypothetical protein [Flavobacterium dauae]WLD24044.1 hypothetical protein NU10_01235 [Flavobacterium dauae]
MFKYFTLIICLPFVATAQQSNAVYYAAPYLQIEKVDEKTTADANDFGYNILIHPESSFIKEAFYMWVDDQWYEILNSKDIFTTTNEVSTLFTISKNSKDPLKIKDVNDVVYLYPIEALDRYIVSYADFITLSKSIEKRDLITYVKPAETPEPAVVQPSNNIPSQDSQVTLLDKIEVVEVPKSDEVPEPKIEIPAETPEPVVDESSKSIPSQDSQVTLLDKIEVVEVPKSDEVPEPKIEIPVEQPKLTADEPVLITSENPSSVLLDVIDVVEVVKREEIPFDPTQNTVVENQSEITEEKPKVEEKIVEEAPVKISATNTPIIANPGNDYEIAVNEGFDGTVTEWIEMIDAQGGKTAYEQAVEKGFDGTEDEWKKMLWGREVDVEIAKRDKTTAIVTEWIQSLNTSKGNSPYELALKHGFYGTFTEWVESVVGTDGEKAYEHAKTKGFEGSYKEWIEKQLNSSNQEVLRKERLSQTQMFVAPNVLMPLNTEFTEPLTFNLFDYYNQFYGSAMITSAGESNNVLEIRPTDLEYQITWFEKDKIKILELSKEGIIKYQPLEGVSETNTKLNVRYILK